jgi:hypothetical protein
MNLSLVLLGLVWLVGLAGVHSVQPQPLARCRRGLRVAGGQRRGDFNSFCRRVHVLMDCLGERYRSRRVRRTLSS